MAAGLLNLTGLGAGYLLLRRWVLAAVCLAATAALLVIALPAGPDGVPAGLLVGYGLLLLVAALDGARRASTSPLRSPVMAMALGIVLLAVPAGGVVAYGAARDDAVEEMLLGRLDDADALVAKAAARTSFAEGRADYTTALARYRELAHDHAGSKAAGLVPDRLDAYYKAVAKPYTDKKGLRGDRAAHLSADRARRAHGPRRARLPRHLARQATRRLPVRVRHRQAGHRDRDGRRW
ncbi:hypothetical protein [Streptomyces sp. NPDC056242]|uniref:hypothetical protein n=1 Tax=Streptomyces sp. NPDC056242 TaxID=3345760 RepID=UPI0035DF29B5